uniref:small monomeric GTPase n=1 Tax=Xenopus tropicalis TaxID=8364 RepID=A0A6I8RLM3_XENTR
MCQCGRALPAASQLCPSPGLALPVRTCLGRGEWGGSVREAGSGQYQGSHNGRICSAASQPGGEVGDDWGLGRWENLYSYSIYREYAPLLHLHRGDTAGQERFHTLSVSYFRGAQGFVLVYDITNPASFENTAVWMRDIKMKAGEEVEVVLLGNKCDREDEREVAKEQGEKLAWEFGIPFFETSAKENINIEKAFITLAEAIYAKRGSLLVNHNVVNLQDMKKKNSCLTCS